MAPPSPVEISHKKDSHQRRPHRFHVSCPLPTQPLDPMLPDEVVVLFVSVKISFSGKYYAVDRK